MDTPLKKVADGALLTKALKIPELTIRGEFILKVY